MNRLFAPRRNRFLHRVLALLAACFCAATVARAGLNLEINMYVTSQGQTYVFYTPLTTNAIAPAAAIGTYVISSPGWPGSGSRRGFELTTTNMIDRTEFDSEHAYGDFNSALQQITNGSWTILFTNASSTNHYTFTVSAPGFTSNMLPRTLITFPANNSLITTSQTNYTLLGPASWSVTGFAEVYSGDFSFAQSTSLASSSTNWVSPVPPPVNSNYTFYVQFGTNYTSNIFNTTVPLNTNNSQAISGWSSTSVLGSGSQVSFSVFTPGLPSSGHTNVAWYSFEDNTLFTQDLSGSGNNISGYANYSVSPYITNSAKSGNYAAAFPGDGWLTPPTNLVDTLARSFSVSLWFKSTQVHGNDTDDQYSAGGIFSALSGDYNTAVMPLGFTGSKLAFYTGGNPNNIIHSQASINTGQYVHLVATRDQQTGEKKLYINGALDTAVYGSPDLLTGANAIYVGYNNGQTLNGSMDEIQIYSGVLSANDVAYLYAHPGTNVANTAAGNQLDVALNTTNLTWSTSGDTNWFVESTNTHDGSLAAQSGSVTNSQTSSLTTVVNGPGTLTFYWSSIANDTNQGFDYEFYMDDPGTNDVADLFGNNSWVQYATFNVPPGQHTLGWIVFANNDTDPTQAGFLDQVSYVQNTRPVITANPFNQTNYPGYNVALFAAATSPADTNAVITWQWFKVGNASPITGATNALFIPTNSGTAGVAGSYYGVASTPGGSTNTTTAVVSFVTAPLPPDWTRALKSPFVPVDASVSNRDYYAGCATDSAGDIYASAQYFGNMDVVTNGNVENVLTAPGSSAAALVKHAPNGNPLWAVGLTNNSSTSFSYGIAAAAAPGNGAYLLANLIGTNWLGTNKLVDAGGNSILLCRFDANGSNVWYKFIGGTNPVFTSYNTLASDASGNVSVIGFMSGTVNFGGTNLTAPSQRGFAIQYDSNGAVRWAQTIPDSAWNLASGGGRLYLSLQTTVSGGVTNASIGGLSNVTDRAWAVACLNAADGQALWLRAVGEQYGANINGLVDDVPQISVSGSNVFLTANAFGPSAVFGGLTVSLPGGRGQFVARYDTNGNPQAAAGFGNPSTTIWASTANASGVYVSGDFDDYSQFASNIIAAPVYAQNALGPLYFTQPFIAKFDNNGNPLWARNGVSSDEANFRGIATTSDGVWASGFVKITNSAPAQFGANSVYSDNFVVGSTTNWTQGGLLAKITETATPAPVTLINPKIIGVNFQFQFLSQAGFNHNILYGTNLVAGGWQTNSTVAGDGTLKTITVPLSVFSPARQGFIRVSTQ